MLGLLAARLHIMGPPCAPGRGCADAACTFTVDFVMKMAELWSLRKSMSASAQLPLLILHYVMTSYIPNAA